LKALSGEQQRRVAESIGIAESAASNAVAKKPAYEQEIQSAAHVGLMRAAESYDRLGISMPWETWAEIQIQREITNFFNSGYCRRARRERPLWLAFGDEERRDEVEDPKSDNDFQLIDIHDLLKKIPTIKHAKLAHSVILDQSSTVDAGSYAGFTSCSSYKAWNKVSRNLVIWGDL
jgi:hypothetical protein